jgi:uncharacterized protein (DUF1330 family)
MKAYLILDIEVHDLNAFRLYALEIPEFVKKHFGRYVVLGGEVETIEGDWKPQKVVVIEFPSKENAHEFIKDPNAQPLFAIRHKSTTSKVVLVEGCMS